MEIDGGLSADGRIHLRKERGGNVIEINPTHIARRHKSGKIPANAAADRDHAIVTGEAVFKQRGQPGAELLHTLASLACRNREHGGTTGSGGDRSGVFLRHAAVGQDQHPTVEIQQFTGFCERAAFQNDIVAPLSQGNR